jgi:Mrp family chromosome partitioning ATPase
MAMPGTIQPSKKLLMVIFAGCISLALCGLVLFGKFYFDTSIQDANQLANITKQPVIGLLNVLKAGSLDLKQLWEKSNDSKSLQEFKNQIRAIRFEIENDLKGSKVIAITSLKPDSGKTFFVLNLAFSYAVANKKVLLIDGNFEDNRISKIISPDDYIENILRLDYSDLLTTTPTEKLVVLGNKGGDKSLIEMSDYGSIELKLQALKDQFDIILIETPSLALHNKAKEWIMVSEKLVPVFEEGEKIDEAKKQYVNYMAGLNGKLIGWVLNKVKTGRGGSTRIREMKTIKKVQV